MKIQLPTTYSADSRWRKWSCNGCSLVVEGTTSLHFMHKAWDTHHIPTHYPNSVMGVLATTSL